MKKLLSFLAPLLLAPLFLLAQTTDFKDYKVVFDLTSKDTTVHKNVVRWLNNITRQAPDAQLEVVFWGQSLDMVRNDRSSMADEVTKWASNNHVSFVVCEGSMKRLNVTKNQLLPGIKTVPDGIYELIKRQREGWGYIKVAQ